MKKSSLILAFLATTVQYYDYALFGMSAAALTNAYIPTSDSGLELLGFFGIIFCSALARPIGSIIFGTISDVKGRALSLKISVLIAAIATSIPGIMQNNASMISASILVLVRMMFMMSMAGEGDGVRIYVAEIIGFKKEFTGNGIVTFCSQIGVLIASFSWWIASHHQMPEYWWRVNFIIGGAFGICIFLLRTYLTEPITTQQQLQITDTNKTISLFVIASIIAGCIGGIYHFQIIFFGTFISKMTHIVTQETAAMVNIIAVILYSLSALSSGYIADKYHSSKQIIISLMATIIFGIVICNAVLEAHIIYLSLSITALIPFYSVPLQIIIKRTIASKHILRTFSLSHSIGSMIFSASVPFVASWIWYSTQKPWVPMVYVIVLGTLILVSYRKLIQIQKVIS